MGKKKVGAILIMIAAISVIVAGILGYTLLFNKNNPSDKNSKSDVDRDVAFEENDVIMNVTRDVFNKLNEYQTNNGGNLPSINGTKDRSWDYFVANYLDTDASGAKTGFSDTYKIVPCDYDGGECKDPNGLVWEEEKNIIYVAEKAACGDNGLKDTKDLKDIERIRRVAFYAALNPDESEDAGNKAFYCISN